MNNYHLLIVGEDSDRLPKSVLDLFSTVAREPYDADRILEPFEKEPHIIVCLPPKGVLPEIEIAQSLRMNYSETPIFYVTFNYKDFRKKLLIKNGFSDVFLLPWELIEFLESIKNSVAELSMPGRGNYTPVSIHDLKENSLMDFGTQIHLSMNNKMVQFSLEGETMTAEKLEKLQKFNIQEVFIKKEDEKKFESYARSHSKDVSHTQKKKILLKTTRDMISELLIEDNNENTFEKSRELMNEVKELVRTIVTQKDKKLDQALSAIQSKEVSFYHHLVKVCCVSALFANSLALANPEEIALAGLLHDIGKMKQEVDGNQHQMHPQLTIDLIKSKRMIVSENTQKAILQHHETMNGAGFPKGLAGNRICTEAKVLAIADSFVHLTTREGTGFNGLKALETMFEENSGDPNKIFLDTEIIKKLIADLRR